MNVADIFNMYDLDKVSKHNMDKANFILSDYVEMTSNSYHDEYKKLISKLDFFIGDILTYDIAKMAVDCFINEDGTDGEHWDYGTTKVVRDKLGYNFNCVDWYFALNKVYSDYYNPEFADEVYFRMAKQYLDDKDGSKNKVKNKIIEMI